MNKIENTVNIHNFLNKLSRKEKDTYLICKLNELVEFVDGLQKLAEKQETIK